MTKVHISFGGVLLLLATAMPAQATLIQNGSFEDVPDAGIGGYGSPTTWQIYADIPYWGANRNIEIWTDSFKGIDPVDGENILELNAHPGSGASAFSIYQDFATDVGEKYALTFYARKRQNQPESFQVSVGDLLMNVSDHVTGDWTEYNMHFMATAASSTLAFTSLDSYGDTTGNLLDHVSVHAVAVPEPGALGLLLAGFVGMAAVRRRKESAPAAA